ncbi:MFS transporter [Methanobacterium oryzae]|uniref:MFS transporter n=1 Tax=Methanobacterium oryzae TaxID=69540 RepID=UPI003D228CFF
MNKDETNKMTVLLVATIASFLTPFMASSVNVALPIIAKELAANAILLSWITTSFLLTSAMLSVPFGRIADIYGMKKIFILGIIIFTIATFLASLSPSVEFLIFARVLQGVGSAMIFVTGLSIIAAVFPPNEMGKAIGLSVSAVFIGLVMGPVLGGILTQYLGWRSIFYLIAPLGLLATLLVIVKLKGMEWAGCKGEKLDVTGSVLYAVSLLLVLAGFSQITSLIGKIMLVLGIISIIGFVIWELKVPQPVLEMKLFLENRKFAFSNLAALISFTGTFAVVFLLSLYLQYIKGLDPRGAGLVLATQTIVMALMSPVAGRLSDKYESRILASIGMTITTVGLIIFAFLNAETSLYVILFSLVLLGIGAGIFSTPNTHAVMNSVKKRYLGVASATISTMRIVGQTLSMGMVLVIFSIFVGAVQFNPGNYPQLLASINVMFTISAILGFIAIFASLAR